MRMKKGNSNSVIFDDAYVGSAEKVRNVGAKERDRAAVQVVRVAPAAQKAAKSVENIRTLRNNRDMGKPSMPS